MGLSAFLQKLLFVRQFSITGGKIDVLGSKYIMLDASDLLVLQNLDKQKAYQKSKENAVNSLRDIVKHANVYTGLKSQSLKNVADLAKKVGKGDQGVINTLQQIFEIYGLGKLEIVNLDNEGKTARLKIQNSTIAEEHLKISKSREPVCSITSGILAGIFTFIFNKDVNCVEKKCKAISRGSCEFEVR